MGNRIRSTVVEKRMRYKTWLLRLLCWDGLLPLLVVCIPGVVAAIAPRVRGMDVFIGVALPIAAFLIRAVVGFRNAERNGASCLQVGAFVAAIILLIMLDALLILSQQVPFGNDHGEWYTLLQLFAVYWVLMAFALFPFSENKQE